MKVSLPQQIVVAKKAIAVAATDTIEAHKIELGIGEDEVAIILASTMKIRGAVGDHYLWLSRKGPEKVPTPTAWPNEDGEWQKDSAVFDYLQMNIVAATVEGIYSRINSEYKVYPYPIVLIREPSMICYGTINIVMTVLLYYLIERVTDQQLSKLMVKDHA